MKPVCSFNLNGELKRNVYTMMHIRFLFQGKWFTNCMYECVYVRARLLSLCQPHLVSSEPLEKFMFFVCPTCFLFYLVSNTNKFVKIYHPVFRWFY